MRFSEGNQHGYPAAILLIFGVHRDQIAFFELKLDSRNHILLADEAAWISFKEAVLEFTGRPRSTSAEDPLLAALSARERQILGAVVAGRNNSEIGAALFVSEKTVRNSLTRIYEKLGVRSRTQAALRARDRGFSGPSGS